MEPLAIQLSRPLSAPSTALYLYLRRINGFPSASRATCCHLHTPRICRRNASNRATTQATSKVQTPFKPPANTSGPTPAPIRFLHNNELQSIRSQTSSIFQHPSIPNEKEILKPLKAIESAAHTITGSSAGEDTSKDSQFTLDEPASALLSLHTNSGPPKSKYGTDTANTLSTLAYDIIKHPAVFITSDILSTYVKIQSLLHKPSTFPEIFYLYANKPIPKSYGRRPNAVAGSSEAQIITKPSNPNAPSVAIPKSIATLALKTSIALKDLPTTQQIIEHTFATKAFQRAKVVRRVLPPAAIVAVLPVAFYRIATEMATAQLGMPAEDFTLYAFAGMLTYAGAVGMMGYITLTTVNDQMQRVTWAIGMPLWERWVREDERAAYDLVACAWGFRQKSRWGEETGVEWEELREYLGVRGMILDKTNLLEGME